MAATAREVKKRIQSVKNIAQITRALQAVSASKVQRAVAQVNATRPYALRAWRILTHLAAQPSQTSLHPLLVPREQVRTVGVILITAERGLAGPYNTNVIRAALKAFHPPSQDVHVRWMTVGRKGADILRRMHQDIMADFSGIPDPPAFDHVVPIGHLIVDEYLNGHLDQVHVVYTDFVSFMRQIPRIHQLLPFQPEPSELQEEGFVSADGRAKVYSYEPDPSEILSEIILRLLQVQIYRALLESRASEHAARMIAMKKATDNATELAGLLQLEYNKARQQAITLEILDIVGGAEALRKQETAQA